MDRIQLNPKKANIFMLKALFAAWVVLWVIFTARDIFFKANFRDYKELISRSAEGKRAYVTGDELYDFIGYCKRSTPESASYSLVGIEDGSIDKPRAAYYLYPRKQERGGDFIFVYKMPGFKIEGYEAFMNLDDTRYILKKRAGK